MAGPSALRSFWHRWKSMRLPWRKKWLVGQDLSGTTFWEFRNSLNSTRPRRIAQYPSSVAHSEVRLAPAWIQWLRHTRPTAPTLQEQQLEVQRQEQLKVLAARADERWEEQERWLDSPAATEQPRPQFQVGGDGASSVPQSARPEAVEQPTQQHRPAAVEKGDNPWKQQRGGPSESWQPAAWNPSKADSR